MLLPYLKSSSESILLVTLATLADLVDDSEAKHLETNGGLFKFLLKCLTYSLNDRHRRCEGWSTMELARSKITYLLFSGLFYSWEYGQGKNSYTESFPTISVKITEVTFSRLLELCSLIRRLLPKLCYLSSY